MSDVIAVRVSKKLKAEVQELNLDYAEEIRTCLERMVKRKKLKKAMEEVDKFRNALSQKIGVTMSSADIIREDRSMPTEIVVDSSVIVALVTPELYSDWSSNRLSKYDYFHILDLNYYEVANAIKHKKSDRFDTKDVEEAFKQALELMNLYTIHDFSEVIADAIATALELDITVYDAAFLSLAKKLDTQLLSLDGKLAKSIESTKYYGFVEYPNKKI